MVLPLLLWPLITIEGPRVTLQMALLSPRPLVTTTEGAQDLDKLQTIVTCPDATAMDGYVALISRDGVSDVAALNTPPRIALGRI